jgi:septum formation topological specificity factor MinE
MSSFEFFIPFVSLPSRKHTLKIIFIKDVSRNNFLKIITHKRELLRIFQKFIELFNATKIKVSYK